MNNITIKRRIIYISESDYEDLVSSLEKIELYDDENVDLSVDECKKYEKKRNIKDVVAMYLWFTLKNKIDDVSVDTYEHIENYLKRHLKIVNVLEEGVETNDNNNCGEN